MNIAKRSQQDVISSLFIIVIIISAILSLFFFFEKSRTKTYEKIMTLEQYKITDAVYTKFISCYGEKVIYREDTPCEIQYDKGLYAIKGYSYEVLPFGYCEKQTIIEQIPRTYNDVVGYYIPANMNDSATCPGILKIYI
jgi:hypothetical protein